MRRTKEVWLVLQIQSKVKEFLCTLNSWLSEFKKEFLSSCLPHRCFHFPCFSPPPKYPVVSMEQKKTIKYLWRTVVALAELRLGSTFEHVSSSVKSRRLVPCMWTNETRLHKGLQSRRRRRYLSTAPCFHQQSEAARACMTSVGMWGEEVRTPDWFQREKGAFPRRVRVVDSNNERGDQSYLGYKFCQRIHWRKCTTR